MHSLNSHESPATESESESVKGEEEEEGEEKSLEEESSVSEDNGDLEKTKEEPVKEMEQPHVIFDVLTLNRRKHHA